MTEKHKGGVWPSNLIPLVIMSGLAGTLAIVTGAANGEQLTFALGSVMLVSAVLFTMIYGKAEERADRRQA